MNYYFIKNGITSGPLQIEDIVKICDDETILCIDGGKITDWKAAKLYPEYLLAKARYSTEILKNNEQLLEHISNRVPPPPSKQQQAPFKRLPPAIPSNKFYNLKSLVISNKLISGVIGLVIIYFLFNFIRNTTTVYSDVESTLKNNLSNLNGEWSWHDKKQDETYWLNICYNESSKSGTYKIQNKADDWGSNTNNQLHTISAGNFILSEGQDRYGDKAYVAKNTSNSNPVFVITQLENRFASDWLLRISVIEDDMFGQSMTKLSNECIPINTIEEMTVPENTITAPAATAAPAATPEPATTTPAIEEATKVEEAPAD